MEQPVQGATLYYDVISPFAYLMHARLRQEPLPVPVRAKPLLFAGLLKAHAHKGPAEIARKRVFTYEFCTWWAAEHGIAFRMPARHPFNPLRYLRLIAAADDDAALVERIFTLLFSTGADPDDPALFESLLTSPVLRAAAQRIDSDAVKARIRANTDEALAQGVFGVPTLLIGKQLFWGVDALPMARSYLRNDAIFSSTAMRAASAVQDGVRRRQLDAL